MDQFGMFQEEVEHTPLEIPAGATELTDDRGVYKIITKQGVGKDKPAKGSKVTVHYTGRLPNGAQFDSSYDRGRKFMFNVGRSEVIKGWDLCVGSMLKGEKCRMRCAPKYGYGVRGSPPKIPGGATLEFDIELFEWEGEDLSPEGDKSIMREMQQEGEDFTMPNEAAEVDIKLVGTWSDGGTERKFFDKELQYNVGEADPELNLVPAIDIALRRMKRGERIRLLVGSKYGFGAKGNPALGVPPDTDLVYDLTLTKFVKARESWEMTDEERIQESNAVKEAGNNFFKKGNYRKALIQYKKILDYLEFHDAKPEEGEEEKKLIQEWDELKLKGYTNLAACHNKLKQHKEAVDMCEQDKTLYDHFLCLVALTSSKFNRQEFEEIHKNIGSLETPKQAIKIDPDNEKAFYRAGEGCYEQQEFEDAKKYFKKAMTLNPSNKQAHSYYDKCMTELKKKDKQEMQRYQGMFDKFCKEDQENEIRKKVNEQKEKAKAKAARQEAKADEPAEGNP